LELLAFINCFEVNSNSEVLCLFGNQATCFGFKVLLFVTKFKHLHLKKDHHKMVYLKECMCCFFFLLSKMHEARKKGTKEVWLMQRPLFPLLSGVYVMWG